MALDSSWAWVGTVSSESSELSTTITSADDSGSPGISTMSTAWAAPILAAATVVPSTIFPVVVAMNVPIPVIILRFLLDSV